MALEEFKEYTHIVSFSLLVHDNFDNVQRLLNIIAKNEAVIIVIHVDLSACKKFREDLLEYSKEFNNVFFAKQVKCFWGDWSLVQAELNCIQLLKDLKLKPKYIHTISGSDIPVRPVAEFIKYLSDSFEEYIETVAISEKKWVKSGLESERLKYYFIFNYQKNRKLFKFSLKLQKLIKINRKIPCDLPIYFGSQFKTITFNLASKVLSVVNNNTELVNFFKKTWIPDESFFPTIISGLLKVKTSNVNLTYYKFNSYGKPILLNKSLVHAIFKEDNFFFARKMIDMDKSHKIDKCKFIVNINNRANVLSIPVRRIGHTLSNSYDSCSLSNNKEFIVFISEDNQRDLSSKISNSGAIYFDDPFDYKKTLETLKINLTDVDYFEAWFKLNRLHPQEYLFNLIELTAAIPIFRMTSRKFFELNICNDILAKIYMCKRTQKEIYSRHTIQQIAKTGKFINFI